MLARRAGLPFARVNAAGVPRLFAGGRPAGAAAACGENRDDRNTRDNEKAHRALRSNTLATMSPDPILIDDASFVHSVPSKPL
jgi:hypothetical protein